jgi:hypothetical protein
MSARKRVRLLLVGEFEVRGPNLLESARAKLDAFREAVQPATEYGLTLYQATAEDLAVFATPATPGHVARGIDPTQAGFWGLIGHRPLTRADTEPYGVEFLTDRRRLAVVRRRYPVPTVIDIGNGIFGAKVGLIYVDDETGRAIAYAPPEIHCRPRA